MTMATGPVHVASACSCLDTALRLDIRDSFVIRTSSFELKNAPRLPQGLRNQRTFNDRFTSSPDRTLREPLGFTESRSHGAPPSTSRNSSQRRRILSRTSP